MGWSGRGDARRSGGAGRGWAGRDSDGTVRPGNNRSSCLPGHRRNCPKRSFGSTNKRIPTCRVQNPDMLRAGQVGAPGGAAGRGRAGLDANNTFRLWDKGPPYPPKHRRNVAPTSFQKHEQAKSYVNRMREQSKQLTRGLSAVYLRFITGTRSALSSWLLTSGPASFCLCKPFSCKACPRM